MLSLFSVSHILYFLPCLSVLHVLKSGKQLNFDKSSAQKTSVLSTEDLGMTQLPETDRESDDMSRRDQSVSAHSRKKRQMRGTILGHACKGTFLASHIIPIAPVHKDDTYVPSTEDPGMTQLPETDRESDDMSRRDQSVSVHSRKKRQTRGTILGHACKGTFLASYIIPSPCSQR